MLTAADVDEVTAIGPTLLSIIPRGSVSNETSGVCDLRLCETDALIVRGRVESLSKSCRAITSLLGRDEETFNG